MTPAAKREAVAHARIQFGVSERRACTIMGGTRRGVGYPSKRPDDGALRARLREVAGQRRRFGYRQLGYLLDQAGLWVNRKWLFRILAVVDDFSRECLAWVADT